MRFFKDSPEYEQRLRTPFIPPNVTLKEVHDAVPKHLLKPNQTKATVYVLRDIALTMVLYKLSQNIGTLSRTDFFGYVTLQWGKMLLKCLLWCSYWWIQGLVNAGIFCLGHDAGHGSLYSQRHINDVVGFLLHSYLLIPYFAWKHTHNVHHKTAGSMERDQNYVPYRRGDFQLPPENKATKQDYEKVFEETPLYTLARILIMQGFGWWLYLSVDAMGSPSHPPGTSHFFPSSALFKPEQRRFMILSNIGIGAMACILYYLGREFFLWHYLIPYLLANHWIVMFTFLHHSDPSLPHYRHGAWTFLRGALATVDRPLLGWAGRFFFHNISHDHVAHHIFLRAPFFNGPEITRALKPVLKDAYNYDSTPGFYALYRSFTECLFTEDEGDIMFYKNKHGAQSRFLAADISQQAPPDAQNMGDSDDPDTFEDKKTR